MKDIYALAESLVFIFALIGVATLLLKGGLLEAPDTRKFVHVGVSHWWLFYITLIGPPLVGLIGAIAFIGINAFSYQRHLFKAMEDPSHRKNLGTIWFPLSLAILIGLEMLGVLQRWEAGVGVLVMGWGDGMAAVIGQRFSNHPMLVFGSRKSIAGAIAMLSLTFVVALIMTRVFVPDLPWWDLVLRAGATALFATFVELATPFGLDNLTVPILTSLFYVFVASTPLAGPFVAATALNVVVGFGAYKRKAVDGSGAVMGAGVGTLILTAGGVPAYALLAGFFLSSTAIGRITEPRRRQSEIEEKGSRRDALQVLANAGAGSLAALLFSITKNPLWLSALATSFAAANADTWASEIGVLSRKLPRSILTGKEVPAGASGGVSPLGLLASALGAGFIGVVFVAGYSHFSNAGLAWGLIALVASFGGLLGSLLDSLLGAAFQAQYTCVVTGRYTERSHTDGKPNILRRGLRWFTNDMVNFASTITATIIGALAYALIS